VGAVVFDHTNRLLLVKRANPPAQGMWVFARRTPGGRGRTPSKALVREGP
jgi:ADP-ribose pyrophosphatase